MQNSKIEYVEVECVECGKKIKFPKHVLEQNCLPCCSEGCARAAMYA